MYVLLHEISICSYVGLKFFWRKKWAIKKKMLRDTDLNDNTKKKKRFNQIKIHMIDRYQDSEPIRVLMSSSPPPQRLFAIQKC